MGIIRLRPGQWELAVASGSAELVNIDDVEYNLDGGITYIVKIKRIGRISDDGTQIKGKFAPMTEPSGMKQ